MLFDLRSRGRRRTVQAVYLGLAILIGGGLVLFGVGTGSGNGGLLNAFGGGGSNQQSQIISSAEKNAVKQTQKNPNDPAAWAALETARYQNASSGSGFNTATSTYTAAGKKELAKAMEAWQKYLTLTKNPSTDLATFAGNAYATLGDYANSATAWEYASQADPTAAKPFVCLAMTAYAAGQTRKGDLAAAKATSLVPKASRKTISSEITLAKTQPSAAQTAC
jgi:tetratricopeptide (TPR) repeat protein